MPNETALVATLAAAFALAFVLGLIAVRLRLPPLVGYLIAGIAVGPYSPGFVADLGLAQQLAEIGIILLMFGVGIHFSIGDLLAVRRIALAGAFLRIAAVTSLGLLLAWLWGWTWGAGIVFGLCLSVASTVVLMRALEDRGMLATERGRIAVAWMIVEDMVTVLVLVLLPVLAPLLGGPAIGEAGPYSFAETLTTTLLKVSLFAAVMYIFGRRVVPWLLERVARVGSRELFTLAVLAISIGIAVGASSIFGVSFALGAFFAGMIVNSSRLSQKAAEDALPLRSAFSVLFFVAVGMLFDPRIIVQQPLQLITVVAVIVLGKSIVAHFIILAFGYPKRTAVFIAASLAQIGEFSFILAALAVSLGIMPVEAQSLIVAGALLSIALNPFALFVSSEIAAAMDPAHPRAADLEPGESRMSAYSEHAVIVGYGRVGHEVATILAAEGQEFVVIEENRGLVDDMRRKGLTVFHGDASRKSVLAKAALDRAALLVVTAPEPYVVRAIVENARTLNPAIPTIARTHSPVEKRYLEENGADIAVVGEYELAAAMGRLALQRLTPNHHKDQTWIKR